MNIKSRLKGLFRRQVRGNLNDAAAGLAIMEYEAKKMAELTFETSLTNPPRTREQIERASWTMFTAAAQNGYDQMISRGLERAIAEASARTGAETLQQSFLARWDELQISGHQGTGSRQ